MPIQHKSLPGYPSMHPYTDEMGYYMQHAPPTPSVFNGNLLTSGVESLRPIHDIDVKPCNECPRNFVIFDQTHYGSQIIFHPGISFKFFHPGFGVSASVLQGNLDTKDANHERSIDYHENSDDIDALLEDEENNGNTVDEEDDDVVSTARTDTIYHCNSPDSCSNYESHPKKSRSLFKQFSGNRGNDKKCHKTRKMVNALRGIIPGANLMSTVGVLDEAVRYLNSLKVEVQKLGASNSKD